MTEHHERRFAYTSGGTLPTFVYVGMSALILALLASAWAVDGLARLLFLVPMALLMTLLFAGHRVAALDKDGERAVVLGPETLTVPRPLSKRGVRVIPLAEITAVEDEGRRLTVRTARRAVHIPASMLEERSYAVLGRELQRRLGAGEAP